MKNWNKWLIIVFPFLFFFPCENFNFQWHVSSQISILMVSAQPALPLSFCPPGLTQEIRWCLGSICDTAGCLAQQGASNYTRNGLCLVAPTKNIWPYSTACSSWVCGSTACRGKHTWTSKRSTILNQAAVRNPFIYYYFFPLQMESPLKGNGQKTCFLPVLGSFSTFASGTGAGIRSSCLLGFLWAFEASSITDGAGWEKLSLSPSLPTPPPPQMLISPDLGLYLCVSLRTLHQVLGETFPSHLFMFLTSIDCVGPFDCCWAETLMK